MDASATTAVRPRRERTHFAIFSLLFAVAVLIHQARLSDWEVVSIHALLSLAALWLLVRPTSVVRFATVAVLLALDVADQMPTLVNHLWVTGVFGGAVAVAMGVALLRERAWARDGGELYARFAPVLRNVVILVYLFAALAKMNDSFLDASVSCAVAMNEDLLDYAPVELAAGWQEPLAIWATIAIELAIPALLIFGRSRLLGIALGVPFHVVLALAGHVAFSGFAMAFYALFLPLDFPARLNRLRARMPALGAAARRIAALGRSPLAFPALALGWLLCAVVVTERARGPFDKSVTVLFVLYAAVLGGIVALAVLDRRPVVARPHAFRLTHPAWALVPVLVVANALSPYVGLKTQVSFTMYSNLQTEGDQWNHALIPESVRVFDLQDDLVRVVSSSDEELNEATRGGTRLVWHDFRRRMLDRPDASVTYAHAGRRFEAARAGDDPRLSRGESLAERKLLEFRDVPVPEANTCRSRRDAGADQGS